MSYATTLFLYLNDLAINLTKCISDVEQLSGQMEKLQVIFFS